MQAILVSLFALLGLAYAQLSCEDLLTADLVERHCGFSPVAIITHSTETANSCVRSFIDANNRWATEELSVLVSPSSGALEYFRADHESALSFTDLPELAEGGYQFAQQPFSMLENVLWFEQAGYLFELKQESYEGGRSICAAEHLPLLAAELSERLALANLPANTAIATADATAMSQSRQDISLPDTDTVMDFCLEGNWRYVSGMEDMFSTINQRSEGGVKLDYQGHGGALWLSLYEDGSAAYWTDPEITFVTQADLNELSFDAFFVLTGDATGQYYSYTDQQLALLLDFSGMNYRQEVYLNAQKMPAIEGNFERDFGSVFADFVGTYSCSETLLILSSTAGIARTLRFSR